MGYNSRMDKRFEHGEDPRFPISKEVVDVTRDGKTFRAYVNEETLDCLISIYKAGNTYQILLDKPVFNPFVNECQELIDASPSDNPKPVKIADMSGNWIIVARSEKPDRYSVTAYYPNANDEGVSFDATKDELMKILNSRKIKGV